MEEASAIGTVIAGSYRITGVLGVGAMGKVYRAEEVERGTPVAIKVLLKHLVTSKEAAARFRREAFVGVKLLHPNCVGITDFGTAEDGTVYLAMELLEGESLGDLLDRGGALPWQRALRIARHALCGLEHAHRESVVHRDIKPDNIFLTPQLDDPDFARVLDFGIAKLVGDAAGQAITQAGITVGTPNYVSPEQATGGALDGRSDLYSLSVVLYEMLVGKPPFAGREPLRIVLAHATEPPPTFAAVAPGIEIPEAVEELVRDGLTKRPDERIPSAGEYIARIDALLAPRAEVPLPAPEVVEPSRTERVVARPAPPARRRRGAIIAAAAVAAVLAVAGVVAFATRGGGVAAKPRAPESEKLPAALPSEFVEAIGVLEKGKTCAARRAAVKTLRALGDARAIPALEKARSRPRRGKNSNACLVSAVDAAITELSRSTNGD